MKRTSVFCVAGALSLGCLATTYYVKPDGSDSATGKSWETAFKTPTKGFAKIHNNGVKDTLIIAPGHYLLSDACACNGQTTGDEVRGETGNPEDVILDGQGAREVMRLAGDVLVHGLTITNGSNSGRTQYASGVRIGSSSSAGSTVSVVSNCVIAGCYNAYTNGHDKAGGAACVFSDGLLVGCTVRGNEAAWRGAGVTLLGAAAEARRCVIEQNISTNDGAAGVWGRSGTDPSQGGMGGRLVDCVVQTNTGNFSAGVTYVRYAEGCTIRGNVILEDQHSASAGTFGGASGYMVTNCTFEGNRNPGGWAAVTASHTGTFVDTRFIGNVSGGKTYKNLDYGAGGLLVNGNNRTVTLDRCVFAGNEVAESTFTGGAIQVLQGTAAVSDCVISNNTAWRGGGIAVNTNGTLRMRGTLLRDNRATVGGGLVVEEGGNAFLDGCTFEVNAATNNMDNNNVGGGGIFLYRQGGDGFCSVSNCVFAGNTSRLRAGGMGNSFGAYAFGEVVNCVFTNNASVRQGGGLIIREGANYRHTRPFVVRNSLFALNKTTSGTRDSNGAGIHFVSYNDVVLDSCTIVSNDSGYTMNGGVHHRWSGTITNCVIAFNTVKGQPEPVTTDSSGAWSMDASCYRNCCIYPGVPDTFLAANGCVNADPLFVDAANGDFTLQPGSPCRNAGVLEDWMTDATDLAGSKRVSGRGVDMGCYERFVPAGLYISFR